MSDPAEKTVVNLSEYGQLRRSLGNGPGATALREVQKLGTDRLKSGLQRMMEKVDDTLFNEAKKAPSNMIQTLYFDAMRELRIIQSDIEKDFAEELASSFTRGLPRQPVSDSSSGLNWEDDSGSSLGLVEKDDMEEELAVSNMIHKVRGTCTQSLYSLDKRIGFLIQDPDLEKWQNPLGPEAVCRAFHSAAKRIETGMEIRLVIFKMFDQHVVDNLDGIYKEVNQKLVAMGVLPEIRATIRRPPGPGYGPHGSGEPVGAGYSSGAQAPAGEMPQGNYAPGNVAGGGGAAQGYPAGYSAGPGGQGAYPGSGAASIQALTMLQQGAQPSGNAWAGGESLQINPAELASGQVNVLHGIRQSPLMQNMDKNSDMTINMVAMLFDYILDDKNIPGSLRAIIGRLQIPVLKVALLDREFFSRKSHPARQLLNNLASMAAGWDEQQGIKDPVYRKIESTVQTVLDEFEDNVALFTSLLEDLESFLRKSEEQAELRAERSARAMEGQEKLEVARSTTMEEIQPRIADSGNLDFVREFVTTHWKSLLFLTCARDGKDSDAWNQAVKTMDELVWSIKPKHTPEERQRLVTIQPQLLQNLREGMERLSVDATERDNFLAQLVRAHGRTAVIPDEVEQENRQEHEATQQTGTPDVPGQAAEQPGPTEQVEESIDDEHTDRARQLEAGCWLDFSLEDGQSKRAKLSWVSPITGTLLFTDQQGLKAGNFSIEELAGMLRTEQARIVDKAPLMDRAVKTVLKTYRKK